MLSSPGFPMHRSDDIPVEYCGEEQAICTVGLVKPRSGVFLEAVQHLVVLCTTTEVCKCQLPTLLCGEADALNL